MLTQEQRTVLQAFVDRSVPGTAFLRRAQILLLADSGTPAETIASQIDVPVTRVRQLTRAFKRQGLDLFPETVLSPPAPFSLDEPIAEAGRKMLGDLLERVREHEADLRSETSVTAVHETRKGIRRLRTALRLFQPYFETGILDAYRKRLRKFMRRLARSRDTAVFLIKLNEYVTDGTESQTLTAEEVRSLEDLRQYWDKQQDKIDEGIRRYLAKGKYQTLLADLERFTQTEGLGVPDVEEPLAPVKTRHIAPVLIYGKVAAVRAYDDHLLTVAIPRLHTLRIQCKELRYTLELFEPALGPTAAEAIGTVKDMLEHLGDLNDARIHLRMLGETRGEELASAVDLYRSVKEAALQRLVNEFPSLWAAFDRPVWRELLAAAVAVL